MIPSHWTPVRRPSDDELCGYLETAGADTYRPLSLVGVALGDPAAEDDARRLIGERGLAFLNRRWWCRLPVDLVESALDGRVDAGSPDDDWSWSGVVLVEVTPAGVLARLEYAPPAELRVRISLPNPVRQLLLPNQP